VKTDHRFDADCGGYVSVVGGRVTITPLATTVVRGRFLPRQLSREPAALPRESEGLLLPFRRPA
jgi:hypothetical protein